MRDASFIADHLPSSHDRPDLLAPAPSPARSKWIKFCEWFQSCLPACCTCAQEIVIKVGERGGNPLTGAGSVVAEGALDVGQIIASHLAQRAINAARPQQPGGDPNTTIVKIADTTEGVLHSIVDILLAAGYVFTRTGPGIPSATSAALQTLAIELDRGGEYGIALGQEAAELIAREVANRGVAGTAEDVTMAAAGAVGRFIGRELGGSAAASSSIPSSAADPIHLSITDGRGNLSRAIVDLLHSSGWTISPQNASGPSSAVADVPDEHHDALALSLPSTASASSFLRSQDPSTHGALGRVEEAVRVGLRDVEAVGRDIANNLHIGGAPSAAPATPHTPTLLASALARSEHLGMGDDASSTTATSSHEPVVPVHGGPDATSASSSDQADAQDHANGGWLPSLASLSSILHPFGGGIHPAAPSAGPGADPHSDSNSATALALATLISGLASFKAGSFDDPSGM